MSAGSIYGQLADAGTDIFQQEGIGPISKWVDDTYSFEFGGSISQHTTAKHMQWHQNILNNGGRRQDGSRIWFCGSTMEDGVLKNLMKTMPLPLQDLSAKFDPSGVYTYDESAIDSVIMPSGHPLGSGKDHSFLALWFHNLGLAGTWI